MRSWARGLEGAGARQVLLLPLSGVFLIASALRRLAYRSGLARARHLPVPVVVVGNITAGGSGKTPLTIWLVERLRAAGRWPGVVSRGYGGRERGPMAVTAASDPAQVGDEPVLIARRTGVPVWIARRRTEAGRALLAAHPEVDVLIADDGLQHYALARDVEVAVVDGVRRFGNGLPLPAGPLREPPSRLDRVDAVVVNGGEAGWLSTRAPVFRMDLEPVRLRSLQRAERVLEPGWLAGRTVHAVAGIGHPERFFATLRALGAEVLPHPFPDHHPFSPRDLPPPPLVMTEKDAVKCAAFAPEEAWVLEVDAAVESGLQTLILNRLGVPDGRKAARDPGLPPVQGPAGLP